MKKEQEAIKPMDIKPAFSRLVFNIQYIREIIWIINNEIKPILELDRITKRLNIKISSRASFGEINRLL